MKKIPSEKEKRIIFKFENNHFKFEYHALKGNKIIFKTKPKRLISLDYLWNIAVN